MKYLIFIFSLLFVQLSIWSQFRPQNGVMKSTGDYTAIVNAHIYISSSEEITKGNILIKDGRILKISKKVKIPKGSQIIDLMGRTVLPAFVELNSNIGVAADKKEGNRRYGLK